MNRIHFAFVFALAGSATVAAQAPCGILVQGHSMNEAAHGQRCSGRWIDAIYEFGLVTSQPLIASR